MKIKTAQAYHYSVATKEIRFVRECLRRLEASISQGFFCDVELEGIRTFAEYKKAIVVRVYAVCDGNATKAARLLKVNPKTVTYWLRKEVKNGRQIETGKH